MAQRSRGGTPRGVGVHDSMTMRDHLEEVSQRLLAQALAGERRGRREPALDDHSLAVAQLAVARRAEDPVPLLTALEHLPIERERQGRRRLATLQPREQDGRSFTPAKARRSGWGTVPATSGRAEVPSSKNSLGSSGSYRGWSYMSLRQPGRDVTRTQHQRPAERPERRPNGILEPDPCKRMLIRGAMSCAAQ